MNDVNSYLEQLRLSSVEREFRKRIAGNKQNDGESGSVRYYLSLFFLLDYYILRPHWEELFQSVSDFIFSKHCRYRSRGVRGVKRPEIL